jgi:hypothetical protein
VLKHHGVCVVCDVDWPFQVLLSRAFLVHSMPSVLYALYFFALKSPPASLKPV